MGHFDELKLDILIEPKSQNFEDFNTYTESKEILGIELGRDALSLFVAGLRRRYLQGEHASGAGGHGSRVCSVLLA